MLATTYPDSNHVSNHAWATYYDRDNDNDWSDTGTIKKSAVINTGNDLWSFPIAVSGSTLAFVDGATGLISTYYDHDNDNDWTDAGTIAKSFTIGNTRGRGTSIKIAVSGSTIAVTYPDSNHVSNHAWATYYDRDNDNDWSDTGTIKKSAVINTGNDLWSFPIAVSGSTLAFVDGATGLISTYYDHDNDNDWTDAGTIAKSFTIGNTRGRGTSIKIAVSGSTIAVTYPDSNHVSNHAWATYYDRDNDNDWSDTGTIKKSAVINTGNDLWSFPIAVSGSTLAFVDGATGLISTYYDHDNDNDWTDAGTIAKSFTIGNTRGRGTSIKIALAYSCPITLPSCSAQSTVTWTEGSNSCTGALTKTSSGQTTTTTDTDGSLQGSATYLCNNGVWSQVSGSCGTSCNASSVSWYDCKGSVMAGVHNTVRKAVDTDPDDYYTGTHHFTCQDGRWVGKGMNDDGCWRSCKHAKLRSPDGYSCCPGYQYVVSTKPGSCWGPFPEPNQYAHGYLDGARHITNNGTGVGYCCAFVCREGNWVWEPDPPNYCEVP